MKHFLIKLFKIIKEGIIKFGTVFIIGCIMGLGRILFPGSYLGVACTIILYATGIVVFANLFAEWDGHNWEDLIIPLTIAMLISIYILGWN